MIAKDPEPLARERGNEQGQGSSPGMTEECIIETENLSVNFKGLWAVKNVNLRVRRGAIHALIGPNGAGKTTCFNLITKFIKPTTGVIRYKGQDITGLKPADIARMGLVRSFQISATFPHLTLLENIRVALQRKLGTSFHFWRSQRSLDVLNDRAMQLLEDVGLGSYAHLKAVELPYGRKRALEIATTLALDPEMLLLDEPMAGMGREDIGRISELIRRVAKNRTVLMVEHNLSVVADLSDTITVLARGEILAEGPYAEVSRNPDVIEAYMGSGNGDTELGAAHAWAPSAAPQCARVECLVRRKPHPPRDEFRRPQGRSRHSARPQWRRQDDDYAGDHGHRALSHRIGRVQRPGNHQLAVRTHCAAGNCLRAGGARHLLEPQCA